LVSRVKVVAPICDHRTEIIARSCQDGICLEIFSDCPTIQSYAEMVKDLSKDDLMDLKGSKVIDLASEAGLTATCLIPTAIFNVCWLEMGMISRTMAKRNPNLCIQFIE
jgi:hypothetical protein